MAGKTKKPSKFKKHTINIQGVYRACIDCQANLHFRAGDLVLSGALVIRPMPNTNGEYIITAHRPDCERLKNA